MIERQHSYAVVGCGRMGRAVARFLCNQDSTRIIKLYDVNRDSQVALQKYLANNSSRVKIETQERLRDALTGVSVCVASSGYGTYVDLTKRCIDSKVHMVDLGGNTQVVQQQFKLDSAAQLSGVSVIPDFGLAPGLINVLGMAGFQDLKKLDATHINVRMMVGGLPRIRPSNSFGYKTTWSVDGLINEYSIPSVELLNREIVEVPALSGTESVLFDNPLTSEINLEAFVTGGGSSNLPRILSREPQAKSVSYKTIRYRGHCAAVKPLNELGLFEADRRDVLAAAIEQRLGSTDDDVVLARACVKGETSEKKIRSLYELVLGKEDGLSAMARSTGFSAGALAVMLAQGRVCYAGVLKAEEVVNVQILRDLLKSKGIEITHRMFEW